MTLNRRGAAAFSLDWQGGDQPEMKEMWRANVYQNTYALPVVHSDLLFGFRGQILTCVNPQTGDIVWRSRPPGGQGLTLLGDHLVIIGKDGALVAAAADGEGYREKARVALFERGSYTPASYADGHLYLRNLAEMAAVRIVEKQTLQVVETEAPQLRGNFGAFVQKVQAATDKKALVDAYMAAQKTFPIVEGNLVNYVFRGDVEDIAVRRGFDDEKPMTRVEGTDLFFYSEELPADSQWEYRFSVYGDPHSDPLNPLTMGEGPRQRNELRMPEWPAPDYLGEPQGERGEITPMTLDSEALGGERVVDVYLPAGYAASKGPYPLVVVNDSNMLKAAKMDVILDNLIGKRVAPLIAVFVPRGREDYTGEKREAYARFLCDELVPQLAKAYRITEDANQRTIMGVSTGAVSATMTALKRPDVFGKAANQSFVLPGPIREEFFDLVAQGAANIHAYVEVSSNDYKFPGFDAQQDSLKLIEALKAKGHHVSENRTASAPSWSGWRGQTGIILGWIAPAEKDGKM